METTQTKRARRSREVLNRLKYNHNVWAHCSSLIYIASIVVSVLSNAAPPHNSTVY
jgi:hypothetical protein